MNQKTFVVLETCSAEVSLRPVPVNRMPGPQGLRRPRFSFFLFNFQRARRNRTATTSSQSGKEPAPSGQPNDRKSPSSRLGREVSLPPDLSESKAPEVKPAGRPRWARGGVYRWDRRMLSTPIFRFFSAIAKPISKPLDSLRANAQLTPQKRHVWKPGFAAAGHPAHKFLSGFSRRTYCDIQLGAMCRPLNRADIGLPPAAEPQ